MENRGELIVALDLPDRNSTRKLLEELQGTLSWVKLGLSLFCKYGPALADELQHMGFRVFLDLKLHDIPHQISTTVRNLADVPADLLTIHASGGAAMIEAAALARDEACPGLKLLAVTVLTSHDQASLNATGIQGTPDAQVSLLANLALSAGADGLVCSPLELAALRSQVGAEAILLAPGIRPAGSAAGDQRRIMSPAQACRAGADYLVVGRPITEAKDPRAMVLQIMNDLSDDPC